MPYIETYNCPACSAKLQISEDRSQVRCEYCGHTYVLRQGDGLTYLFPVANDESQPVTPDAKDSSARLVINQIGREVEEVNRFFDEKEKRILYKHITGNGLSVQATAATAVLIQFKDKENVTFLFDREKFNRRFYCLSNADIDFLVKDAQKYAADPKIYEKPQTIAFMDDLREIKRLRVERDLKLSLMEAEINKLSRNITG